MTTDEKLHALCEQCRASNPGKFFWWDESGVHFRDYAAGKDFLVFATVLHGEILDGELDGKFMAFDIPKEGPALPPPFEVGETIIDKKTGEKYTAKALTLIDSRRYGMTPYWRALGEKPRSSPRAWCGATLEQSEEYWLKETA